MCGVLTDGAEKNGEIEGLLWMKQKKLCWTFRGVADAIWDGKEKRKGLKQQTTESNAASRGVIATIHHMQGPSLGLTHQKVSTQAI